jgi:hypothetical protein
LAAFFLICAWNDPDMNRMFDRTLGVKLPLQASFKREDFGFWKATFVLRLDAHQFLGKQEATRRLHVD